MRAGVSLLLLAACHHGPEDASEPDSDTDASASVWFEDHDGDGLGGDLVHEAATAERGWVATTGDCDDHDPDILGPSPWYLDDDGDGFAGSEDTVTACEPPAGAQATADDCDDADRAVYPGAPAICGDGIVNDCNGPADPETGCRFEGAHDVARDRWRWTGSADSYFGLPGTADIDGDGRAELILSAPGMDTDASNRWREGTVYVLPWDATPGPVDAVAEMAWSGSATDGGATEQTGVGANGVGDLDGDGRDEVIVATNAGTAFLVSAPPPGMHDIDTVAVATFQFGLGNPYFVPLPDPERPEARLLALTTRTEDDLVHTLVYQAPLRGVVTVEDAWMSVESDSTDGFGGSVAALDANGDGQTELAVEDREEEGECGMSYDVFVIDSFLGGTSNVADLSDVHLHYCDASVGHIDSADDVNGDGYDDLLVSAEGQHTEDHERPWFGFLYYGPLPSSGTEVAEDVAPVSWVSSDVIGGVPAEAGGDLDGDGFDDVVINTVNWDGASNHFGDLKVFYGPLDGTLDLDADADASFYDERYTRFDASELEFVGDLDRDGRDDLLVGAINWGPDTDYGYGAAYLILGGEVF